MQHDANPPSSTLPLEQRHRLPDRVLAERLARRGWRLEFYTEVSAVIVRGRPVNHLVHATITLFTVFWLIVWLSEIAFGGEKREMISVDPYGRVDVKRLH